MIIIENIHKEFGENKVLNNVSFDFEQGKTNLIKEKTEDFNKLIEEVQDLI